MLEFLIKNIYVVVGGQVFQQSIGIPMGTNCAPLLANLFLYSYEMEFIQKLLHEKKKNLLLWPSIRHFDISTTFYLLTIINSIRMSIRHIPMIWKSKTPQCSTSASYLDVLLKLDTNGKITTQLYDKRVDFNFSIVNFPYLCSNMCVVCIYRSLFVMQELARHTSSFWFEAVWPVAVA
jgi:hypothetical protein